MTPLLIYSLVFVLLFGLGEVLLYKADWKPESTRTLIHVATGLISFTFPTFLTSFWQVAVLCITFMIFLIINEKIHFFKSISGVQRKSFGSWLYAVSVLICFYVYHIKSEVIFYYLPLTVLAICDPLASIVGSRYPIMPLYVLRHPKSLGGSAAFLMSCLTICMAAAIMAYISCFAALTIALCSTLIEWITIKGWDNLTIPLIIIFLLNIFL